MSDLDDEELEATRRLNGVAKESDIEKDIKRCEKLTEPQNANWIGISNQLSIAHLIERIKELEAKLEFKNWGDLDNTQFEEYMNQFISKTKIKNKIDEIIEDKDSKYYYEFLEFRDIQKTIDILSELLQEEDK